MAGSAIIGALRVVLGMDSAALSNDTKKARAEFEQFGADIAKAAAVAAAAVAAAFAGVSLAVTNSINKMDAIGKQAQKIGIPVEQLSALTLAADLADVSMESLGKSVGRLSKTMTEAIQKPTSDAALAFKDLGIDITQATGDPQKALLMLADRFSEVKDGAAKTAAAIAIFGKAGADMIPLLNSGAAGINAMMTQAQQLGLVIDNKTAKAAERFNDTLKILAAAKDALIMRLTAHLLPALQAFADRMLQNATNTDKQQQKLSFLTSVFEGVAKGILLVVDNYKALMFIITAFIATEVWITILKLAASFISLARAIAVAGVAATVLELIRTRGIVALGVFAGGVTAAAFLSDEFRKKLASLGDVIGSVFGATIQNVLDKLGLSFDALNTKFGKTEDTTSSLESSWGNFGKQQEELVLRNREAAKAFEEYIKSSEKAAAATIAESVTVGALAGEKERLKVVLQGYAVVAAKNGTVDAEMEARLAAVAAKTADATLKTEGWNLVLQNMDPLMAYQVEMEKIRIAMEAVGATSDEITRAQEKNAQKFGMSWQQIGTNIAGTAGALSQFAGVFAKENRAMAIAQKAFGVGQAIINTQVGITKALELPPPASYAAIAFAVATGAAAVATILAQGFATGGSFKVPGGVGGGDKVFTPMMLQPGEQVDIWRPGQAGGGSGDPRGGGGRNVTVSIDPGPIPREWVEKLIGGLNDAMGDGHKLRLA